MFLYKRFVFCKETAGYSCESPNFIFVNAVSVVMPHAAEEHPSHAIGYNYRKGNLKYRMKNLLCIMGLVLCSTAVGQMGIGTNTPNASSILELKTTNKGFLPPRMTDVQRDSIVAPVTGLTIFNTNSGCLNIYIDTAWFEFCGVPVGTIAAISCTDTVQTGSLQAGVAATGVSTVLRYTNANGGSHNGVTVNSTGVAGLTATLAAGSFAKGAGELVFAISGTPVSAGEAAFTFSIGGKVCTITRQVAAQTPAPALPLAAAVPRLKTVFSTTSSGSTPRF